MMLEVIDYDTPKLNVTARTQAASRAAIVDENEYRWIHAFEHGAGWRYLD